MSQDIKVRLQVIAKQCAASTQPCPYCEAKIPLLLKSKLNTISSLLAHHNKWIAEGSKLWDLKKHNNVIHPPILTCNPDQPLHEALNIPGLHILLGITDKILTACEKNLYDSLAEGFDRMTAFLALLNIKRVCYQGSHIGWKAMLAISCSKMLANLKDSFWRKEKVFKQPSTFRHSEALILLSTAALAKHSLQTTKTE